ncbi:MAG: SpoIID/LytB domain-containing protein [Thermoanaerobaculia bacterium]
MNVSVGLVQGRARISVELAGSFVDGMGASIPEGRHTFEHEQTLTPVSEGASFALDDVVIGVGFHWERQERQMFRGALRIVERNGLTAINDIALEEYVTSVISSEMSAGCPPESLKAHAVISRSWLWYPKAHPDPTGAGSHSSARGNEIERWYGREAHQDFDVCADDHCQRYQGITRTFSPAASEAVKATAGELLRFGDGICDARFSKCCGGLTEEYRSAWDDKEVPYLVSIVDAPAPGASRGAGAQEAAARILETGAPDHCNTSDRDLLSRIFPGFDQETRDFYRWTVVYSSEEIRDLVLARHDVDLGEITGLQPLSRGPSGRIVRLQITGSLGWLTIGKELEIRRTLSRSHLYSSAFVVERQNGDFALRGAGWGHGVGLCQVGAAVMAAAGRDYREILAHYYRGARVS